MSRPRELVPTTPLKWRIGRRISSNKNDRVGDMGRTDLSRVSLYSVRVTSADVSTVSTHPWCCSVDRATCEAFLSLNCQGVDVGCTWSTFLAWLGFVQPLNVGLYFMAVGTAEGARLGTT